MGVEVKLHVVSIVIDGSEWSVSRVDHFTPWDSWDRVLGTPWTRDLVDL
jgi:hypothetical protein